MRDPIRVRGLRHVYDRTPVLAVPELDLAPGRHHLQGPNGAGKTTLLKVLASLIRPTGGQIHVAGHRLPEEARQARASTGFAGHQPSLHGALPARRALEVHARLHEVPASRVEQALAAWGLASATDERVASLSHGQRRRLDLARCLLHEPDVVLLDEPASGLDRRALAILEDRLEQTAPQLVLVADPGRAPLHVDTRLRLEDGRIEEEAP